MNLLLVFLGGGIGSCLRYLISTGIQRIDTLGFPFATFLANVLSCGLMILLLRYFKEVPMTENLRLLLLVGLLGGLSTFSTFSYETAHLIREGHLAMAFSNIGLSVSVCVFCLYRLT